VVAGWVTQYEVTFKVAGLPNSTQITLNVNNQNHLITPIQPYSAWYNQGQTLNPTTNQTVLMFFQFANWRNSTGSNITPPITVTAPAEYTATYQFAIPTLTTNPPTNQPYRPPQTTPTSERSVKSAYDAAFGPPDMKTTTFIFSV